MGGKTLERERRMKKKEEKNCSLSCKTMLFGAFKKGHKLAWDWAWA